MKISADALKSIDYKKLALNHAEKLVAGVIGLLVVMLFLMPLFTGKFSGYEKTPEDLTSQAAETHKQILASQWPEAEKLKFQGNDDLAKQIALGFEPVSPGFYEWSIEIAPPLYRKKEPRKDPVYNAVDGLIVVAGRGHFEVPKTADVEGSEETTVDENGETVIPLDDQSDIPAQFRRKTSGGTSGSGFDDPNSGCTEINDGGGGGCGDTTDLAGAMEMDDGDYGEGSSAQASNVEGRGYRYALLTGIFNIRSQREQIAKALSIPEVALDPSTVNFELLGFEVARKEGTGEWLEVDEEQDIIDIKRSMQVLMDMAGFDYDRVGFDVTHQQITSPLPPRIVGEWGDEVVHPKISNYMLSEEGKELNQFMTEYLAKKQDQSKKLQEMEKKNNIGFGDIQRNIQGIATETFGGGTGNSGLQEFTNSVQTMSSDQMMEGAQPPSANRRQSSTQKAQMKSAVDRITAAGTLLLFRYFDFDVEPGKTYQYRVRLIFQNPNYNVPVSELENPDSRLDETHKTPWSDLVAPVTILKDTEYFLAKVSVPPGKKSEESSLLLYQWKPEIGTVVSNLLSSKMGQYIGGEKLTEVLRPAPQTFEPEKVEFTSDDLLVDSSQGVDVNSKDHADLKLPKRLTGKGRLRIMDEALVQGVSGRIFAIDPFSSSREKQNARRRFDWQNQAWEFLKEESEDDEDSLGGFGCGGADSGEGMGDGESKKPRGRRGRFSRKNKLKKSSGSAGGFSSSMQMP